MKKIPVWATVLTILGVVCLCSLGFWQVKRLHWKTGLLRQIDAAYRMDPAENPLAFTDLQKEFQAGTLFLRGTISGHFLNDPVLRLGPRIHAEQQGYHLIMAFALDGGGTILVNRGWMPLGGAAASMPAGPETLSGLFRLPDQPNSFTPPDALGARTLYSIRIHDIADFFKLGETAPYVLYAEAVKDQSGGPLAVADRPQLYNSHLAYAFFWFAMAGLLVIIYTLRFLLPERKHH